MRVSRIGVWAVLLLVLAVPWLAHSAQNAPPVPPDQSSPQAAPAETSPRAPARPAQPQSAIPAARSGRPARQVPCWSEAGISPAVVNQRWQIEDTAKRNIDAVCSDDSLTPEKKRGKIQQINEQTEQEIAKIIPAKQLEAFKACQAGRDRERKRAGSAPQKELGPCGGIIPAQPGTPPHSHEHQPSNPPNH